MKERGWAFVCLAVAFASVLAGYSWRARTVADQDVISRIELRRARINYYDTVAEAIIAAGLARIEKEKTNGKKTH